MGVRKAISYLDRWSPWLDIYVEWFVHPQKDPRYFLLASFPGRSVSLASPRELTRPWLAFQMHQGK